MNSPARGRMPLFALLIILAGCAGSPVRHTDGKPETMIAAKDKQESNQSQQLSLAHLQEAERLLARHPFRSGTELQQVELRSLGSEDQNRYWLAYAQLHLDLDEPSLARESLLHVRPDELGAVSRHSHDLLKARLATRSHRQADAVRYWQRAVKQRPGQPAYGERLWHALLLSDNKLLKGLLPEVSDPLLQSWLELAILYTAPTALTHKLEELQTWKERWRGTMTQRSLPEALQTLQKIPVLQPAVIALLLPLSGARAHVGSAVRDGFMAGYYHSVAQSGSTDVAAPRIRFYDTEKSDPADLVLQAQEEGAQLLVGPLRRSMTTQAVQRLSESPDAVRVPWLLLNAIEGLPSDRPVYQFSILSEDEARDAAGKAWQDGYRHPLLITADSDWGERVADSFKAQWTQQGGRILDHHTIKKGEDYSRLVRKALLVTDSLQRAKELNHLLGYPLDYTPRRREDADVIFLAASPGQGRGIKPTLNFYFGSDIPVYAVSSLYAGRKDPQRDRDLDSVRIPLMPWLSGRSPQALTVAEVWPNSEGPLAPFYALGLDSWTLHPQLAHMAALSDLPLAGATGTLRMTQEHRVMRELDWYFFRNGRLTPMGR